MTYGRSKRWHRPTRPNLYCNTIDDMNERFHTCVTIVQTAWILFILLDACCWNYVKRRKDETRFGFFVRFSFALWKWAKRNFFRGLWGGAHAPCAPPHMDPPLTVVSFIFMQERPRSYSVDDTSSWLALIIELVDEAFLPCMIDVLFLYCRKSSSASLCSLRGTVWRDIDHARSPNKARWSTFSSHDVGLRQAPLPNSVFLRKCRFQIVYNLPEWIAIAYVWTHFHHDQCVLLRFLQISQFHSTVSWRLSTLSRQQFLGLQASASRYIEPVLMIEVNMI